MPNIAIQKNVCAMKNCEHAKKNSSRLLFTSAYFSSLEILEKKSTFSPNWFLIF